MSQIKFGERRAKNKISFRKPEKYRKALIYFLIFKKKSYLLIINVEK